MIKLDYGYFIWILSLFGFSGQKTLYRPTVPVFSEEADSIVLTGLTYYDHQTLKTCAFLKSWLCYTAMCSIILFNDFHLNTFKCTGQFGHLTTWNVINGGLKL